MLFDEIELEPMRTSVGYRKGDRERRRKGDDATDSGECQDERPLPRRRGILASDRGNKPARQIGCGIHPDETSHDDHGALLTRRFSGSEARDAFEGETQDILGRAEMKTMIRVHLPTS